MRKEMILEALSWMEAHLWDGNGDKAAEGKFRFLCIALSEWMQERVRKLLSTYEFHLVGEVEDAIYTKIQERIAGASTVEFYLTHRGIDLDIRGIQEYRRGIIRGFKEEVLECDTF